MSYGYGPYGMGPYGTVATVAAAEVRAELHSSRLIMKDGRYGIDDDTAGFLPMDDVHQRIYLALAYKFEMPKIVGRDFQATIDAKARTALASLTPSSNPDITILECTAKWVSGNSYIYMRFMNHRSGVSENIEVPV